MKALILIGALLFCSCKKQTCSEVLSVVQAPIPYANGMYEVKLSSGYTIYTNTLYKVGDKICE